MTRKELLNSKEYWTTGIKIIMYETVQSYIEKKKLTIDKFCLDNNLSKRMVKSVLSGDFNGSINNITKILMACDKVPVLKIKSKPHNHE